jgi:hypothetical protein
VRLVRATKRPYPRPETRVQLRKAAMRRWGAEDTLETMALRLGVRLSWLAEALFPLRAKVLHYYGLSVTADEIAEVAELPIEYVKYVFRHVNASRRG